MPKPKSKKDHNCGYAAFSKGFGRLAPAKDPAYFKCLFMKALESRNEVKVRKILGDFAVPLHEGDIPTSTIDEAMWEISYGAFVWYYNTFCPDNAARAPLPYEDEPALEDAVANQTIRRLIDSGLVFGQDFSFYQDGNSKRHLKISPEGLDKLSADNIDFIRSVTEKNQSD